MHFQVPTFARSSTMRMSLDTFRLVCFSVLLLRVYRLCKVFPPTLELTQCLRKVYASQPPTWTWWRSSYPMRRALASHASARSVMCLRLQATQSSSRRLQRSARGMIRTPSVKRMARRCMKCHHSALRLLATQQGVQSWCAVELDFEVAARPLNFPLQRLS